jgi:hypothetical protein
MQEQGGLNTMCMYVCVLFRCVCMCECAYTHILTNTVHGMSCSSSVFQAALIIYIYIYIYIYTYILYTRFYLILDYFLFQGRSLLPAWRWRKLKRVLDDKSKDIESIPSASQINTVFLMSQLNQESRPHKSRLSAYWVVCNISPLVTATVTVTESRVKTS